VPAEAAPAAAAAVNEAPSAQAPSS
jgi:hypothetical protein